MQVREPLLGLVGAVAIAAEKAAQHTDAAAWLKDSADVIIKVSGAAAIVGAVLMWLVRKMLRPAIRREILRIFEKDIKAFRAVTKRMECIAEECEVSHESVEQIEETQAIILEMLEDTREWIASFSAIFDRAIGVDRRVHSNHAPNNLPERRHDDEARINARLIERSTVMERDRSMRRARLTAIARRVDEIAPEITNDDEGKSDEMA